MKAFLEGENKNSVAEELEAHPTAALASKRAQPCPTGRNAGPGVRRKEKAGTLVGLPPIGW